jgi:hypothetical protein
MHLKFWAVAPVMSLLLSATLILSACGGDAAETPSSEQSSETTPVAEVAASPEVDSPAEEPETATEITESEADDVEDEVTADKEEISATDPATPVECESIEIPDDERVPAISADDWVKGPESASLTLVEYGDFQ